MRISSAVIRVILCLQILSSYSLASINDIERMEKRGRDTFMVTCENGLREMAESDDIRAQNVCGAASDRYQIKCEGIGVTVYPVRTSDGARIGGRMSAQDCYQVVDSARQEVMCAKYGSFWYVTRIGDGRKLGVQTSLDSCLDISRQMREGVACIPRTAGSFRVTRVRDANPLGLTTTNFSNCINAIRAANEGVTCAYAASGDWSIYRIHDGKVFGSSAELGDCQFATYEAFEGKVCVPVSPDHWQLTHIQSGTSSRRSISLAACVTQA